MQEHFGGGLLGRHLARCGIVPENNAEPIPHSLNFGYFVAGIPEVRRKTWSPYERDRPVSKWLHYLINVRGAVSGDSGKSLKSRHSNWGKQGAGSQEEEGMECLEAGDAL